MLSPKSKIDGAARSNSQEKAVTFKPDVVEMRVEHAVSIEDADN